MATGELSDFPNEGSSGFHNRELVRLSSMEAQRQRVQLIHTSYMLTRSLLKKQDEMLNEIKAAGFAEGTELDYWVMESDVAMPISESGDFQRACGILLLPDQKLGKVRLGKEKLRIFIPVESEGELDEILLPNAEESNNRIVVEHTDPDGILKNYLISRDELRPFKHEFHEGKQVMDADLEDDAGYFGHIIQRINPRNKLTGELFEMFTEWSVAIQRTLVFHGEDPPEVRDIE